MQADFICKVCGTALTEATAARHGPTKRLMRVCIPCNRERLKHLGSLGGQRPVSIADRFMRHVEPVTESGCWMWIGKGDRYGHVSIGTIKGGDRRTALAHRVSYELHRGPIPSGMLVCHRCDVPCCVNPAHLFLGDDSANTHDAIAKGKRSWRGRNNPHARKAA